MIFGISFFDCLLNRIKPPYDDNHPSIRSPRYEKGRQSYDDEIDCAAENSIRHISATAARNG